MCLKNSALILEPKKQAGNDIAGPLG